MQDISRCEPPYSITGIGQYPIFSYFCTTPVCIPYI